MKLVYKLRNKKEKVIYSTGTGMCIRKRNMEFSCICLFCTCIDIDFPFFSPFKKKVNPDLVVDIKPSLRHRKIQEERLRRQQIMDDYYKRREEERWREEMR